MLDHISLENYRCFERHEVDLRPLSIIVGGNNAGKSTLVEALRLLSIAVSRYKNLAYNPPPSWTAVSARLHGVSPSLKDIELRGGSVFHRYGNPPAIVKARFSSGAKCDLYVNADDVFAVLYDNDGSPITSKSQAIRTQIPLINILPQIGPLLEKEPVLTAGHVAKSLDSSLASRHFRNQLHLLPESTLSYFKKQAEVTWKGLHIESLDKEGDPPDEQFSLLVRDGNFAAEIGWMGHGVQMWLQTMWFLARSQDAYTIILDEPDVYMHADLQRRLVRLLRSRPGQTIIATHSVEIMSEVSADEIIVIDKRKSKSSFAASLPAVQNAIDKLGGVQNIHLARLWSSRKCLHVEGKDIQILKILQDTLRPNSEYPFLMIPCLSIGGWNGWPYAIGSTMNLRNSAGENITSYCVFDSDYHTDEEIAERHADAKTRGIQLHIWHRKEIENYLLIPEAIWRILKTEISDDRVLPSVADVETELSRVVDGLYNEVLDAMANEYFVRERSKGITTANQRARAKLDRCWADVPRRRERVSGKDILSRLSGWSHQTCGVSFGALRVARELKPREIDPEMADLIRSIDDGKAFSVSPT
jgi:predicted ATPase